MSKVGKWESGKPHLKKKFDFQQKKSLKNFVNSPKIRTFVPLLENDIRQQNLRHNYRENFSKCTSKFFIVKPQKHGLRKRF